MLVLEYNQNNYQNSLSDIKQTYSEFKSELDKLDYLEPGRPNGQYEQYIETRFDGKRNPANFGKKMFPYMSGLFSNYIKENSKLPTFIEFSDYYCFNPKSKDFFEKEGLMGDNYINAIKKHIIRSYPSLIRDIAAGLYFKEKLDSDWYVMSNKQLDGEAKIDILLTHGLKNYGLMLFVNTPRSSSFADDKLNERTIEFTNVEMIKCPIDVDFNGKITLYGDKEFEELIKKIQ